MIILPGFQNTPTCSRCTAREWKTPALILLGAVVAAPGLRSALPGVAPLTLLALGIALILGWTLAVSLRETSRRREAEQTLAAVRQENARLKTAKRLMDNRRAELRTAIEGALAGVYIIQHGKFRYVNSAMHEIFGYKKGDIVDRLGPEALVHPADRSLVEGNIERRLRGDVDTLHYTFRGLHRDGSILYCEVRGRRVLLEGEPAIVGTLIDMTAQKQAEQRLAHERELLYALMENIPDTIYFKDTDRRFIRVNPAQADLLGIDSPDEAVGKTDFDFFPEEFALEAYVDDQHVLDTGEGIAGKVEALTDDDGEVHWLSASKVAIRDEDGEVTGIVGITREITDRHRIEQAEREQRALAEALRATAQALTSTLDLDDVLDRILENLGSVIPHDTASITLLEGQVGRIVRIHGHGDHRQTGHQMLGMRLALNDVVGLRQMLDSGQPLVIPDVNAYPDWVTLPRTSWVQSYAAAPIVFGDRTLGFIMVDSARPGFFSKTHGERLQTFANQAAVAIRNARLYSELERYNTVLEQTVAGATTELRQTLERQEAILYSSPDAILTLDAGGAIDSVNPAFADLFGYSPDAVVQQPLTRLVAPSDAERLSAALSDVAATRQVRRTKLIALRKNGTTFDANVSLAPIDEGGTPIGMVCTLWDITPIKEIERLKDSFVSNAAHELRTPLTSIHGYAELLLSRELEEERQRRYLTFIYEQSRRLSGIVDDLFDIAHFESHHTIELHREPVDVEDLIEGAVAHFREVAPDHQIDYRMENGIPRVPADPFRLSQVLHNLLSNALKYSPGGGKIEIRASMKDAALLVEVRDEGIGIEPGKQAAIFDKFYRADGSNTAVSGTGLGLTIARHIIRLHGGTIWVESEPEAGSTFFFTIPFERRADI